MKTALVLGGGGVTGIAWELGLLAGLADRGVDLTGADLVIGTSAGSVVGAQVTSGTSLAELYDAQLQPAEGEIGASLGVSFLLRFVGLQLLPGGAQQRQRRVGRAALQARTQATEEQRVEVIGQRLRSSQWPDRDLRVTAVEAATGEFVVFDRHGEADLVHAVAASCAVPLVWPPVRIGGRAYVDGGVRSGSNADLADGADVVVVLAPMVRALRRDQSVSAQLARTGARGSVVISPDAAAVTAIGRNVLDPARRAGSARAGYAQAFAEVDRVREAWVSG